MAFGFDMDRFEATAKVQAEAMDRLAASMDRVAAAQERANEIAAGVSL